MRPIQKVLKPHPFISHAVYKSTALLVDLFAGLLLQCLQEVHKVSWHAIGLDAGLTGDGGAWSLSLMALWETHVKTEQSSQTLNTKTHKGAFIWNDFSHLGYCRMSCEILPTSYCYNWRDCETFLNNASNWNDWILHDILVITWKEKDASGRPRKPHKK